MDTRSTRIQLTFLIFVTLWIPSVNSQECASANFVGVQCASAGDLMIVCPQDHVIEIVWAAPKTLREPGCTTDLVAADDACLIEPLTSYVNNQICGGGTQRSCNVSAGLWAGLSLSKCNDYHGDNIMHYIYKCNPVAVTTSMCEEELVAAGSLVQLVSSPAANTDCMCVLDMPAHTKLVIKRTRFDNHYYQYNCDQRVEIADVSGTLVTMCRTERILVTLDCDDQPRNLSIRYLSDVDPLATINFQLDFSVRYDKSFNVRCGLPSVPFTSTEPTTISTTTTPTTTTPTTTTPTTTTPTTTTSTTTTPTTTTPTTTTPTTTTPTTTTPTTTTPTTTSSTTTTPTTTTPTTTTSTTTTTTPTTTSSTTSQHVESTTTKVDGAGAGDGNDIDLGVSGSTVDESTYVLGMSRAVLIGLVVGVVAFIFIVSGISALIAFSRKNKDDDQQPSTTNGSAPPGGKMEENVYDEVKMYNVSNGHYEQPMPTLQRPSKQDTPLPAPPVQPAIQPIFYPASPGTSSTMPPPVRDSPPRSPTREMTSPPRQRQHSPGGRRPHSPHRDRHRSPRRHRHHERPRSPVSPRTKHRGPPSPRNRAEFPADEDIAHNPLYGRAFDLYNY